MNCNIKTVRPGRFLYKDMLIYAGIVSLLSLLLFSCKKDDEIKDVPYVIYSIEVNGSEVSFHNETKGAASFKWDFGDGTTSVETSPTHTYPGKGKYVPTLYATYSGGKTEEASTVLRIAKTSAIKMNDNSLSDWDTVKYNVIQGGPDAGNFIQAKFDYDGNNIYFYFEQHTQKSDGNIYDIYIDADNNPEAGYLTGDIPGGAYDILLEGTIFDDWLDVFYHTGDQASFDGFAAQSISEFYTVGTAEEKDGVLRFEGQIKRSKLKGLTGQGVRIGVQVASNDWSAMVGYIPDMGTESFYLDMGE